MIRADEHMPEMTAEELAEWQERMMWQEYTEPQPDNVTVLLHNCQPVTMDAADVAEFAERIRRCAAHGLARIAEQRAARAATQRHISRYNEHMEIAAEVYAATSDTNCLRGNHAE